VVDADDARHVSLLQGLGGRHVAEAAPPTYLRSMSEQREAEKPTDAAPSSRPRPKPEPREIGGPKGPEPTRYGDWEVNGRVTDF
jgi:hypothetical protein